MIGTEAFIAPEVMGGEPASERSDLYALGVMLADIAREGADPAFWALTDRLRDGDPEARPESAEAALDELERRPRPAARRTADAAVRDRRPGTVSADAAPGSGPPRGGAGPGRR